MEMDHFTNARCDLVSKETFYAQNLPTSIGAKEDFRIS